MKDDERVKALRERIDEYRDLLVKHRISDHRVATARNAEDIIDVVGSSIELVYRFFQCLLFSVVALPGMILAGPILVCTRGISNRKAREAKSKSFVKIDGRDVVATWKLLVSLVVIPLAHLIYTTIALFAFGTKIATAYFYFSPFVVFASILAVERGKRVASSIVPLLMSALKLESGARLYEQRRELQQFVRSTTKALGWDKALKTEQPHLYRNFSTLSNDGDESDGDESDMDESSMPEQWFLEPTSSAALRRRVVASSSAAKG